MKIDHIFLSRCGQAIADMREAGMSEARIARVLFDIRAAGLLEERMRLEALYKANPPTFEPWGEIMRAIAPGLPSTPHPADEERN